MNNIGEKPCGSRDNCDFFSDGSHQSLPKNEVADIRKTLQTATTNEIGKFAYCLKECNNDVDVTLSDVEQGIYMQN